MSGRLAAWCAFVGVLILLNWAGRAGSGKPDPNAAYGWSIGIGSIVQFGLMLGVLLLIAKPAFSLLAFRRPRSWLRALGTAILILLAVDVLNVVLDPYLHAGREQGIAPTRWEPGHAPQFAAFAFAVVVMAPLAEELTFRGLGFSLLRPFGLVPPLAGTAVVWAFAHGLLSVVPVVTALGLGLAYLRWRQDSIVPGMLLHSTFNGIALALAVTT